MKTESEKIISDLDFGQRYTECTKCGMLELCHGMYDDCVFSKAISHIKHQDAELEALTISNKNRLDARLNAVAEKEKAEVEVIKNFVKKLLTKRWETGTVHGIVQVVTVEDINKLLNETVCEPR